MSWLIDTVTPIISIFYHPPKWPYTINALLQMPDGSLGKQTALLLQQKHFSFIPKYESHDCKHVLLDYEMNGLGESRMVFFSLGNGNKSFITYISIALSVLFYARHYKLFYQDYQRGKQCAKIAHWDFAKLMDKPCNELRLKLCHHSSNNYNH